MSAGGIGLFSDIHGNRQALGAIARVVRSRRDLRWICLGDIVGWFFRPVECVLAVRSLVAEGLVADVIPGNHDLMALNVFTDDPARSDRMLATAFSAGALEHSPQALAYLRSLKTHALEGDTWIAAHHSPFELHDAPAETDYGSIEKDLPKQLGAWARCRKPVVLTGHGHVASVYGMRANLDAPRMEDVTTWRAAREARATTLPIEPGWRYWIRNGTVGGPYRDRLVGAHWTEYLPGERIVLHRETYDTAEIDDDIAQHSHLMTHRATWQKDVLPLLARTRAARE